MVPPNGAVPMFCGDPSSLILGRDGEGGEAGMRACSWKVGEGESAPVTRDGGCLGARREAKGAR